MIIDISVQVEVPDEDVPSSVDWNDIEKGVALYLIGTELPRHKLKPMRTSRQFNNGTYWCSVHAHRSTPEQACDACQTHSFDERH